MSLLFDALKRAQGNDAKPDAAPQSDGISHSSETARTVLAAGNKPRSKVMPYVITGLVLLSGALAWFIYQQNQHTPVATLQPELMTLAAGTGASEAAAASSVAETTMAQLNELPATASGAESLTYKDKAWTRPVEQKKSKSKKRSRKASPSVIKDSTRLDPLHEGYLALSEGRLYQAEQSYLAALSRHPQEKDALLGLAVIAQRKMQTERARELYQQVLREDLGNTTAAAGLVSLSVLADPVAAESQLRELLDLKPTSREFHYALGGVLARQQRWGEAQQAFFHAYELQPGNALYAYNLAVSLDRLHQPAAALPYYEKSARMAKPSDPSIDLGAIKRRIEELNTTTRETP